MLQTIGKRALGAFGATVGVLVLCGLILGFVEGKSTTYLYGLFGWGGGFMVVIGGSVLAGPLLVVVRIGGKSHHAGGGGPRL